MSYQVNRQRSLWLLGFVLLSANLTLAARMQDPVTGAFEGTVSHSQTQARISGALVEIINQATGVTLTRRTDAQGRFYQGLLPPGIYTIRVTAPGFDVQEKEQRLYTSQPNQVVPIPFALEPAAPAPPQATATPTPMTTPLPATYDTEADKRDTVAELNRTDARRVVAFTEREVTDLTLGSVTITRSFDELALLLPGVAPPPQTLGTVAGPGVGAGVGSAGQFAVNGLRSRANNFTVDGSDNNDEDIGVRRQGFVALVPQSIESVKEYQVTTALAPAQFGRNIGAQVNAVSKSGGNETHGALFGLLNTSQLNARDYFDTTNGNDSTQLHTSAGQPVLLDGSPLTVHNQSDGKDSFTATQAGLVLGGPLVTDHLFYFLSGEREFINATKEESFAVPTVEQRGIGNSGATGIYRTPLRNPAGALLAGSPTRAFPTQLSGDAIFSLFPFPNNPRGVYGANTFTQALPAGGQGRIFSGKYDANFNLWQRQQALTGRYNYTDDSRDIPVTGGAIFSTLRPDVRTQNYSTFLNSELTHVDATHPLFNQLRLSYGRTRLNFAQVRTESFLLPSSVIEPTFGNFGLLNARFIRNTTMPASAGVPNNGPVRYTSGTGNQTTVEQVLSGPLGQVSIAGFSPIGVDVYNFPQRRVNNTYQLADTISWRGGRHSLIFGTDLRRTELNSELPRNFRPLLTINGAPQLTFNNQTNTFATTNEFISPLDLAAGGAASGFSQTLVPPGFDSHINLRFYQFNYFGQDEWRLRPNLTLAYGLRYEYNTPPRESRRRIESAFTDPALSLIPGLRTFIAGRTQIFDPDRNNFAPRVGLAYAPALFGAQHSSVIRIGYGLYYDQIPGAVVSQSRNVFPPFLSVNTPGGRGNTDFANGVRAFPYGLFTILNPVAEQFPGHFHVQPGTLNTLANNEGFTTLLELLEHHIEGANFVASGGGFLPAAAGVGITIPARDLEMPMAHQYSIGFEQQLGAQMVLSAAYVGTTGRHLLRFTTPNLGANSFIVPLAFQVGDASNPQPSFFGVALPPGSTFINGQLAGGRPVPTVGVVNRFETTANSRYDSLQLQLRGESTNALSYQVSYTLAKAIDDVSDVFDLAGASALPQNSLTFAGERAAANYDVRHLLAYNFIYSFPDFNAHGEALHAIFNGLQLASTGRYHSGQPFTVNSIFDVNLDGNLTDRLNAANGIVVTGDRRQPLRLATDNLSSLLAPIGRDGSLGRNTFRAGNFIDVNLALLKNLKIIEQQRLVLRVDFFNFINRANFGLPVRFLEAPAFGQATHTVTPGRRVQFGLKYLF